MRSISEQLESFAEAWRPEPGDALIGEVVDLDERDSEYGDVPYPIVTVLTDDGNEVAFHGFHTIARRELAKKQPQVGERIGIKYIGPASTTKAGMSPAQLYKIVVEREESKKTVDWERIGAEADAADGATVGGGDGDIPFMPTVDGLV
jgi:hypothetical protein